MVGLAWHSNPIPIQSCESNPVIQPSLFVYCVWSDQVRCICKLQPPPVIPTYLPPLLGEREREREGNRYACVLHVPTNHIYLPYYTVGHLSYHIFTSSIPDKNRTPASKISELPKNTREREKKNEKSVNPHSCVFGFQCRSLVCTSCAIFSFGFWCFRCGHPSPPPFQRNSVFLCSLSSLSLSRVLQAKKSTYCSVLLPLKGRDVRVWWVVNISSSHDTILLPTSYLLGR